MKRCILFVLALAFILFACTTKVKEPLPTPTEALLTATLSASPTPTSKNSNNHQPAVTPYNSTSVPNFEHIVVIIFENKESSSVIGNPEMPAYNRMAQTYASLEQYFAVTHPSLPNYLAMIGGDTFGIQSDCENCFINATSLPDEIETSGRSWKAYQESMPKPCFIGSMAQYAQKHNPFIYFDPIRLDQSRCEQHIVPLTQMQTDLDNNSFPNFAFIAPNMCNDAHDCPLKSADAWLEQVLNTLIPALDADKQPYLIVLTWDEGEGSHSCCGLPQYAGGRVATVLISPQVKNGFKDETPYTHYSLLKTIEIAWGLPFLGHAGDQQNVIILAPWK